MAAKKGGMRTTGDVVGWWVERLELNRSVSASYRRTMASLMRCHVLPALGAIALKRLTRAEVDDRLGAIFAYLQECDPAEAEILKDALAEAAEVPILAPEA